MIEDLVLFHLTKFGNSIQSLLSFPPRLKRRDEAVPQEARFASLNPVSTLQEQINFFQCKALTALARPASLKNFIFDIKILTKTPLMHHIPQGGRCFFVTDWDGSGALRFCARKNRILFVSPKMRRCASIISQIWERTDENPIFPGAKMQRHEGPISGEKSRPIKTRAQYQ